jgi:hypothetical protein
MSSTVITSSSNFDKGFFVIGGFYRDTYSNYAELIYFDFIRNIAKFKVDNGDVIEHRLQRVIERIEDLTLVARPILRELNE